MAKCHPVYGKQTSFHARKLQVERQEIHPQGDMMTDNLQPVLFGWMNEIIIFEHEKALLYQDCKFVRLLDAGRYRFSRFDKVHIKRVSTRILSEVISGQEILTS